MKNLFKIVRNEKCTENVYEMVLQGDTARIVCPGQFVNIALEGKYLRRPISVCNVEENLLTIVYKVVGHGTHDMSRLAAGNVLDLLTGLGNGFDIEVEMKRPLVIGGGVGVPPLYMLTKKLVEKGYHPTVILGFNTAAEVYYKETFEKLGVAVRVTTVDGSAGIQGFVTRGMDEVAYDYTFSCGPEPMLKAVYEKSSCSGQYSFEERMACGFGACMGCSCRTKYGYKRICTDGPVLTKEEIIW